MSNELTPLDELISVIKKVKHIAIGDAKESLPDEYIKFSLRMGDLFFGTDANINQELQFQVREKFKACFDVIDDYAKLHDKYTRLKQDYQSILENSGLDDFEKQLLKNLSQFLGKTEQFGILDPTGAILAHNLTEHTVQIAKMQLLHQHEYSVRVGKGELYACQYKDFTIIVERNAPLSTTEKNHIKLTVKYISLQRMQNTLKQAMIMSLQDESKSEASIVSNMENSLQKGLDNLVKDATVDPLTLAFNRRYLLKHVERLYADNIHFSIIIADIDYFKQVNDTYGHDVGDQILSEFVKTLTDNIRDEDVLSRWGGEEFLIILESADLNVATNRADILRKKIENHTFSIDRKITASFGVASKNSQSNDFKELVKKADNALYRSKSFGRNRVESEY